MFKPKLTIELVPKTSHYTNVRTLLPKKTWDMLRKVSYAKANNKCQICGDTGKNQGYRHNVECHEIWEYTQTGVQLLKGLISLCPKCHQVKHYGRAQAIGKGKEAFTHLMKVNKWDKATTENYIGSVYQEYKIRSKVKWKLNLAVLNEKYDVSKDIIKEYMVPTRGKTVIPPWKSKASRKKTAKKKTIKKSRRPKR